MLTGEGIQRQRRRRFTDSEDGLLTRLVEQLGTSTWANVAAGIPGRTARQCRSRWKHYVSGRHDLSWTRDEDDMIWEQVAEIGPKWTRIGKLLKNRTDIEVKGRWQYLYKNRHSLSFRQACREAGRRNAGVVAREQARSSGTRHGDELGNVGQIESLQDEIVWRDVSDRGDADDEDGDNTSWNWFRDHP